MAEIKTLEQYAITRIQDLEAQIDDLRVQNEDLRKALDELAPYFKIVTNHRGDGKYISFNGPWNNEPRFNLLVKLFGIKNEEE